MAYLAAMHLQGLTLTWARKYAMNFMKLMYKVNFSLA